MTKIEKFEDIEAWQRARDLTKAVYIATGDGPLARDFGLRDQLRRVAVSVMSNIAEGFNRSGNRELIQFLFIAKGSATEVQAQLYVVLDTGYLKQAQFQQLYDLAGSTCQLIGGFIQIFENSQRTTQNA